MNFIRYVCSIMPCLVGLEYLMLLMSILHDSCFSLFMTDIYKFFIDVGSYDLDVISMYKC